MDKKGKVLVALSGGVDSSVTAIMLKNEGYDVIAMTLKTWDYESSGVSEKLSGKTVGCCSLDDINDARNMCVDYDIPHYILDIRDEFNDAVIDDFVDEYMAGRTPNPCTLCNTHIKWGALLKRADALDCDYIATGHYAKIKHDGDRYYITAGVDDTKDQSYVLWGLSQEVMARTLLPMGDYHKSEIKQMALDFGYENLVTKPESYEICFIPDNDYRGFLSRKREIVGGDFINTDFDKIGEHDGYPYFTIGQRRGLGITFDKPHYVVNIIPETNEVMLGTEDKLMKRSMLVRNVNGVKIPKEDLIGKEVLANVRYRGPLNNCRISAAEGDMIRVDFNHLVSAITPGQSTVFYDTENPSHVLGGGHIYKVIG